MRPIKHIHGDRPAHWVGDGFYVKTLINYLEAMPDFNYSHTDPFLLFDYGEPTVFAPNPEYQSQPHGIGPHPHRGFETVTIAYEGELTHADSAGGQGVIREGDVQWMTAGRGITHEQFHSADFGQYGGSFSMVQMWVNLPQQHKLTTPKYQTLRRADIPSVDLYTQNGEDAPLSIGNLAIIAGDWQGSIGAASTFTPINLWDIELHTAGVTILDIPNTHNVLLLVQEGEVLINGTAVGAGKLIQFEGPTLTDTHSENTHPTTDTIELCYVVPSSDERPNQEQTLATTKLLVFSGTPIGEPVAGYGPFVMSTQEELKQTFRDYQTGHFG